MSGLVLSPDGSRLVTQVATLNHDATKVHTALWEVYPTRARPARRLTRSAQGESGAAFTPDGDLLFTSSRPNADAADDADKGSDQPALWVLPAGGGEARIVATCPGGVRGVRTAHSSPAVVFATDMLPSAKDGAHDETLRKLRKDTKVNAILHDGYPVRYWDHDLGPDSPHLLGWHFEARDDLARSVEVAGLSIEHLKVRDLAPEPGHALREAEYDFSPDGSFVVSTWRLPQAKGAYRTALVLLDIDTQQRTVLVDDPDADLGSPAISPDGTAVVYVRESVSTPDQAPRRTLHLLPLGTQTGTAAPRQLVAGWDRWATGAQWLPDGSGLLVTADQDGRAPVFAIDLATDTIEQLTHDDSAYSDLQVAPDASVVYALRSSYLAPAHPVRVQLTAVENRPRGTVTVLRAPAPPPTLPGMLTEVRTTVGEGDEATEVRGWLALPDGSGPEDPAPLLLWIHGGPLGSWNTWSWRWNPWLMVAQGYAVLLPDPALSTGYGQDFVQRGWGRWGAEPYTDLMAITDATVAREDIDETRTAAMGGSFGGYMANWVAGQTDRFQAVVTHASLWALDQFGPTTDASFYWAREMTAEMAERYSPHRNVGEIRTPMLVVHGDKDYRVPIGEGLRLWYELLAASQLAADDEGRTPHRFLYFPDENHWILTPQHAKVWYQVVNGFLAEHVLGAGTPTLPETLG
ncbi:prolyl oligopeptidase family serine peptidase [Actinotalea sp. K2]|nr:alpha/beta fold hydrolase [Actinotalea sp. K2]MCL3860945.1 prolyl oligopeptidase family serine peptidase [Actinotalea sp. K2]